MPDLSDKGDEIQGFVGASTHPTIRGTHPVCTVIPLIRVGVVLSFIRDQRLGTELCSLADHTCLTVTVRMIPICVSVVDNTRSL